MTGDRVVGSESCLVVEFAGDFVRVQPEGELTFGRAADLEIDTNPYLSRRVGVFRYAWGGWWLFNTGTAIVLDVADTATMSRSTVAPGAAVPLSFTECVVRFQAGRSTYQVTVAQPEHSPPAVLQRRSDTWPPSTDDEVTITASSLPLNLEQRLLLVGLAQHRLRDPAVPKSQLATNAEVTSWLGWSKKKFDSKLDNLCQKFAAKGVAGLTAGSGGSAWTRRERLVDHVLLVGMIGVDDLNLYEQHGPG